MHILRIATTNVFLVYGTWEKITMSPRHLLPQLVALWIGRVYYATFVWTHTQSPSYSFLAINLMQMCKDFLFFSNALNLRSCRRL